MKKLSILLLFIVSVSVFFYGCSKKNSDSIVSSLTTIEIKIDENSQLIFDGEKVDIENFKKFASNQIKGLVDQGINIENIEISLKADKSIKMGMISDLQDKLRELNIRKINYSTI